MTHHRTRALLCGLALGLVAAARARAQDAGAAKAAPVPLQDRPELAWWRKSMETRDARLAWWREARFGMFIHWGAYSELGGVWHDTAVKGYAEHIMRIRRIPRAVYADSVVARFDPVHFDADAWVRTAKRAGMRYMIITAKHHDGFAMFASDVSDYNVVKATPWKRDPMRELRDAARRQGIRFGFYYSHAFDWEHPDAPGNDWDYDNPAGDRGLHGGAEWWLKSPELLPKVRRYVDTKAIPQLQELIRKYDPDILWLDTPGKLPPEENLRILKAIREAKPDLVVNGRGVQPTPGGPEARFGDYASTADRPVELTRHAGDWEAIPTTNESYGWHRVDRSHKPPEFFVRLLAKAAARGGNLLMNIGPMGDGRFDPADSAILAGIGRWMDRYSESIRGTTATPLPPQVWGESTRRGNLIYLHVFSWPRDGRLYVAGLRSPVLSAHVLGSAGTATVRRVNASDVEIHVPAAAADPWDAIVVLECAAPIRADTALYVPAGGGPVDLHVFNGWLRGHGIHYGDGKRGRDVVLGWRDPGSGIDWPVRLTHSGRFRVLADYAPGDSASGGSLVVSVGARKLQVAVRPTAQTTSPYASLDVGEVTLAPGRYTVSARAADVTGAELMRLQRLRLVPLAGDSTSARGRAEALVRQMTLDEKVLQIHMMDEREHPREVPAIERLGIPALKISNGPAGAGPGNRRGPQPATALPSALALAATWDATLAEAFGSLAAREIAARGERLLEAPGLNIARVPQNGRNFEYFGEDPYLAGRLGVAEVRGIQREGVIAEPKHYAANNQENDRKTVDETIDERTLREIYLPAFEATVKEANPGAVMCAYPSVNGSFGCENTHLLKDILRGEWGFQGFVQSDYTATHSTVAAALAGLDLSMKNDTFYGAGMKRAVVEGRLPESVVDSMLIRRYSQMIRLGLFRQAWHAPGVDARRNGAVAREIAEQGAVLLKNARGLLPLRAGLRAIAVIGPYAGAAHTGGSGSSAVTPLYTVAPVAGIERRAGPGVSVRYADGADTAAAAALARSADVAIVMVGNKDREGRDRPDLALPDNQDALVAAVAAANPRTIVVLKTGGPVLMPWLERVPAVLEAWYPGEEDGNAVAALLFGQVSPSGRLPISFPRAAADLPAHTPEQYPGVNGKVTYSERLEVGYRWYDARGIEPLFPFGFGLSYTSFALHGLQVNGHPGSDAGVRVGVDIRNTGRRSGADVVQVYVAPPAAAGEPPHRLAGFARVQLAPGETRHVTVRLDSRAFSVWDTVAGAWKQVPGSWGVLAGHSSRDLPLETRIAVEGQQ